MAFKKRTSPVLDKAVTRATSISAITAPLDLGGGLTLAAYQTQIANVRTKLDAYNALLSSVDSAGDQVDDLERSLADLSERMLAGVGTQFGKDSPEYEAAGGTRKSDHKPRKKKA